MNNLSKWCVYTIICFSMKKRTPLFSKIKQNEYENH